MSAVGQEVVYRSDGGVDMRSLRQPVLYPYSSRNAVLSPVDTNAATFRALMFKGDVQVGVGRIVVAAL
jgi:hypothetical protein